MRHVRPTQLLLLALALSSACGGCDDDANNAALVLDVGATPTDAGGHADAGGAVDAGDPVGDSGGNADGGNTSDSGNGDSGSTSDSGTNADSGSTSDSGNADGGSSDGGNTSDGGEDDAGSADVGPTSVCGDGVVDLGETCDDGVTSDCTTTHDGGDGACVPAGHCSPGYLLNQGACVLNPTGLTTPCESGPGWTLFRYHYSGSSTSARIDVWDAACSYSLAPGSICEVRQICPGFCDVNTTGAGYPIFTTSHYMRVRFDVTGINFSRATLWVEAAGYAGSTTMRAWSPLYGDVVSDIVSGFSFNRYGLDWSAHLFPNDPPSLTAVQLYAVSSSIAVASVEMCLE